MVHHQIVYANSSIPLSQTCTPVALGAFCWTPSRHCQEIKLGWSTDAEKEVSINFKHLKI